MLLQINNGLTQFLLDWMYLRHKVNFTTFHAIGNIILSDLSENSWVGCQLASMEGLALREYNLRITMLFLVMMIHTYKPSTLGEGSRRIRSSSPVSACMSIRAARDK